MNSFSSVAAQLAGQLPTGAFSSQQGMGSKMPGEKIPSGYRKYAVQQFTPEQMDLYSQLFSHLDPNSYLSKLAMGDQSQFSEIEAPALKQFNELMGGLSSKFSGMGLGGRKSSGFQHASTAAAQDFASQLQSNRQNIQRQAIMDLMGLSEALLGQRPYTSGLSEKRQNQDNGFFSLLGQGLGAIPGFITGGPQGAMNSAKMTAQALGGF